MRLKTGPLSTRNACVCLPKLVNTKDVTFLCFLFVIWHKLCSPISIKAAVAQNGPLSSSYLIWQVFRQVNHAYSLDAIIRSSNVGNAHYELFSAGLSGLLLESFGHTLTLFDKLPPLKFCVWGLQSRLFVPVFLLNFLDYNRISIMSTAAHKRLVCFKCLLTPECFPSLLLRFWKHFENIFFHQVPFILCWH